jgi:hypothetical protein
MDTIEDNKLIAEFMGAKIVLRNNEAAVYMFEDAAFSEYFRCTSYNQYHFSWTQLMTVVEKINSWDWRVYYACYAGV